MLPLVLHSSASIHDTSQVLVDSGLSFGMQLYGYTKVNQICAVMYTLLLPLRKQPQ